jgi:hypothetical protein
MRPCRLVLTLAAFVAASGACTRPSPAPSSSGNDSGPAGASCDAEPDPHCDNPVNRVLVPMLRAAHVPLRDAAPEELCRRAFVDLIGRIPTRADLDGCITQKPGDVIDALMRTPDYPFAQARWWAETLGFNLFGAADWYLDVFDLDALVRKAYAVDQPLPYGELAARAVMHPAVYSAHQGDDWTKLIWQVFLGRTARLDEVEGFRPLTQVWGARDTFCDGTLWWATLAEYGGADAVAFCNLADGYPIIEWGVDFCQCDPTQAPLGCSTSVLGSPVDFGSDGCTKLDDPANLVNFYRLTDHPAGAHTACPDGSVLPECQDRIFDPNLGTIAGALPIAPALPPAQAARLHQLGDALAARPDFWEAAVNREIKRFVGWWQQGVRRPDYDIPDVRAVLAAQLKKDGSLASLQRVLLTSLLYDAPADAPAGVASPPPWSMGPSKFLGGEMWLDSAAVATTDTVAGICDYRFLTGGFAGILDGTMADYDLGEVQVDAKLVARIQPPLAAHGIDAAAYYGLAQQLGGCNPLAARPRRSTVGAVYAQHDIAQVLCAYGGAVLPPGFDAGNGNATDGSLGAAASWIVRRAWSRDATAAEVGALVGDMKQCLAAGSAGCSSPEAAVRWACARVLDSAPFALY